MSQPKSEKHNKLYLKQNGLSFGYLQEVAATKLEGDLTNNENRSHKASIFIWFSFKDLSHK